MPTGCWVAVWKHCFKTVGYNEQRFFVRPITRRHWLLSSFLLMYPFSLKMLSLMRPSTSDVCSLITDLAIFCEAAGLRRTTFKERAGASGVAALFVASRVAASVPLQAMVFFFFRTGYPVSGHSYWLAGVSLHLADHCCHKVEVVFFLGGVSAISLFVSCTISASS